MRPVFGFLYFIEPLPLIFSFLVQKNVFFVRTPPISTYQITSLNKLLIFETFFVHFDTFQPHNVTILYNMTQIVVYGIETKGKKKTAKVK